MENIRTKLLIIGSGPAGYSAAIYAARANLSPIIVQGLQVGGQLTITTDVENYPGFAEVIQGPFLMKQMLEQAKNVGSKIINDHIISVNFSVYPLESVGETGNKYISESVIIAVGAQAKWLEIASEKKFQGFGVSGCATCDGFFYKQKIVAVVGGGNTAIEEALYLTNHASKVIVIHRRNEFKAEKILQDRLFKNPKIEVIWDHIVDEILGEEKPLSVNGVRIKNVKDNSISEIKIDGIFIAIGHIPNTKIFKNQVEMDEEGYIKIRDNSTRTNIRGVFAAGDVHDKIYRQAITAASFGCMAALDAQKFLANEADEVSSVAKW